MLNLTTQMKLHWHMQNVNKVSMALKHVSWKLQLVMIFLECKLIREKDLTRKGG